MYLYKEIRGTVYIASSSQLTTCLFQRNGNSMLYHCDILWKRYGIWNMEWDEIRQILSPVTGSWSKIGYTRIWYGIKGWDFRRSDSVRSLLLLYCFRYSTVYIYIYTVLIYFMIYCGNSWNRHATCCYCFVATVTVFLKTQSFRTIVSLVVIASAVVVVVVLVAVASCIYLDQRIEDHLSYQ